MSAPVQVSPLIKTARWGLLLLGIAYGYKHNQTVKVKRTRERVAENAAVEKYLKEKKEAADRERIEFEKTSILYQK